MWYDVVINGGGMAATPLFAAQAKKILSGDLSFVAFLRYVSALATRPTHTPRHTHHTRTHTHTTTTSLFLSLEVGLHRASPPLP